MDKDFLVALKTLRGLNMRRGENDTLREDVLFDSKEEALEQIIWLQGLKRGDLVYNVIMNSVGIILSIASCTKGITLIYPARRDDDNDYIVSTQSVNFLRKPTAAEIKKLPKKDFEICRRIAALKKGDIVKFKDSVARFALVERWLDEGTILFYIWNRNNDCIHTAQMSACLVVFD